MRDLVSMGLMARHWVSPAPEFPVLAAWARVVPGQFVMDPVAPDAWAGARV